MASLLAGAFYSSSNGTETFWEGSFCSVFVKRKHRLLHHMSIVLHRNTKVMITLSIKNLVRKTSNGRRRRLHMACHEWIVAARPWSEKQDVQE